MELNSTHFSAQQHQRPKRALWHHTITWHPFGHKQTSTSYETKRPRQLHKCHESEVCVLPRRHGGPLHNVFRGDLVNLHIQISTRTWLVLTRDTSIDCRGLVSRDNVIKSHFRRRVFTNLRRCLLARKIQCACVPPKCPQPSRPRADSVSGNRLRAQLKFNA